MSGAQALTMPNVRPGAVLNALPHPILVIDPDGRIAEANQAAEDFFQSSASFLARHDIAHFVPFGSPLFSLIEQVRARGATVTEYRVDVSSPRLGIERIVDIYASPVR
jgi:two-component system, NtrC family, nitrogen regulation sensor histidine kinase GlnL